MTKEPCSAQEPAQRRMQEDQTPESSHQRPKEHALKGSEPCLSDLAVVDFGQIVVAEPNHRLFTAGILAHNIRINSPQL